MFRKPFKMKFEYYGHACFLIDTGKEKLLFDPYISENPLAENIDIQSIKADYIFISHAHDDHIADLALVTQNNAAKIVCNFEIMNYLSKQGFDNFMPMNIGGKFNGNFGTVRMTQAIHSSSFSDGTYGGTATGFLLEIQNKGIYYAGDTALFSDLKLLAELHKIDWALLPVGGLFTMDVQDATIAAKYLNCNQVIGLHFDTFAPIKIDPEKAHKIFLEEHLNLILPQIQQSIIL